MKPLAIFSDLHGHNFKQHSTIVDGVNSRLKVALDCWDDITQQAFKEGCSGMMFGGDLFNIRGNMRPSVFNAIADKVKETANLMDFIAVAGNHDFENFHYGETSINSLRLMAGKNVPIVATEPLFTSDFCGLRVLAIPYINDVSEFLETFKRMAKENKPNVILMHNGIDDYDCPGMPGGGITAAGLSKIFKGWIFSGHYHNPGQTGKVVSIGAPYEQKFDEGNHKRGFWMFYPSEDRVEFRPLNAPQFITLVEPFGCSPEDYEGLKGQIVRIKGKSVADINAAVERAKAAGAISVVTSIEKEFKSAHEKTVRLSTPEKMLAEYIDIMDRYKPHKAKLVEMFGRVCAC